MSNNQVGRWSSFGVFLVGLAYIVALIVGFTTRGLSAPIVDPLLAIMEMLTLIAAPLMLVMMAAVHGRASGERKTIGSLAFAFMLLTTGTTSAVHFVNLTATRQLGSALLVWPSPAYALELLAWDVFLGLSLVFASFTFHGSGRENRVKRGLLVCGVLCLVGAVGPAVGNMRLQLIGVFAYGGVLPVVSLVLSRLFRDEARTVMKLAGGQVRHFEGHRTAHIGWLRAAVLGANDGLISTASLVLGVAAAGTGRAAILIAGVAGLVAGAMSMAAGEYVSVSSQADTEAADMALERHELATAPEAEKVELTKIYEARGLEPALARQVAEQLMERDALGAHARDELGLSAATAARPLQAAMASALSFAIGAGLPVAVSAVSPTAWLTRLVTASALVLLTLLGAVAARVGGAPMGRGAFRVVFWGALAMATAAGVGHLFGTQVP